MLKDGAIAPSPSRVDDRGGTDTLKTQGPFHHGSGPGLEIVSGAYGFNFLIPQLFIVPSNELAFVEFNSPLFS